MKRVTQALPWPNPMSRTSWLTMGIVLLARPVMAHPGGGSELGLTEGVLHPFSGLDHLLLMFAVGLLAARLIGRMSLVIPLAFALVTFMSFPHEQVQGASPALAFTLGQAGGSCLLQLIGISLGLTWDRLGRERARTQQARA